MKKSIAVILLFLSISQVINLSAQSNDKLWYNQPALYFEESLVLGNGKMGASVF
jgi:alpha-L-fucosidase 2